MAQRNATVRVDGNVVKTERKNGSMPDRENPSGPDIVWDYVEAKVITPEFDTVEVRFPSNGSIPLPARDELVSLICEARVSGGNLRLQVTAIQPSLLAAGAF